MRTSGLLAQESKVDKKSDIPFSLLATSIKPARPYTHTEVAFGYVYVRWRGGGGILGHFLDNDPQTPSPPSLKRADGSIPIKDIDFLVQTVEKKGMRNEKSHIFFFCDLS